MIRKLEVADSPMVRTTMQTMAATMYPELIPDIEKVHWLIRDATSSDKHYARVVGPVGEPKAVLVARVQQNMWAAKKSATVLLWYSEQPGAGAALMRDFMKWVVKDPQIVMAGLTIDWCGADWRVVRMLEHIGFVDRGGSLVYFPRGRKDGLV